MAKTKKQVNFDMSKLSLGDLIKVYEEIINFKSFLEDTRLKEEKEGEANE